MSQHAELGVIHDIGFRHYTGPRLGRGYLFRSLYVESLKGAYGLGRSGKSKVLPFVMLALMIVPALIIAVVAAVTTGADELPLEYTAYAIVLWPAISVFVAAQAPASVSRDLRFKVMPLYFSRPLARSDYVLAKYAALSTAVFILIALPLIVLYAGALLGKLAFWANTRGVLGGLIGAVLFALLLSVIAVLIASITPKRGFGIAAVIGVLLVLNIVGGVLQNLVLNKNHALSGYFGAIGPFTLVDGIQVWLFGAKSSAPAGPPGTLGGIVFALILIAVIAACYGLLQLRYRKVSAS